MNTPSTPFTDVYSKWLQSFRPFIPGAGSGQPVVEKKAEVIAKTKQAAPKARAKPRKSTAKAGSKRARSRR